MKLTCIVCPRGCELDVKEGDEITVTGNFCPRGEVYGKSEILNPVRTLTSTVRFASNRRLPVITSAPIPKDRIFEVMKLLKDININHDIKMNDIILENVLGLDINIVASRSMKL